MKLPQQIQHFHRDQQQAIALLQRVLGELRIDQSERDVLHILHTLSPDFGFTGWVRTPVVHFDYRLSLRFGPSESRRLQRGSVVQIHLQPCSNEAFANTGVSFTFQSGQLPIVTQAKELCIATCTFANHFKRAGELFVFADSWCTNHRNYLNKSSIGHICLSPEQASVPLLTWPMNMRIRSQLRRHQLQWYNPRELNGVYAVHPDIKQDGRRAGFAEMIYIDETMRIALGRNEFSEICTFEGMENQ